MSINIGNNTCASFGRMLMIVSDLCTDLIMPCLVLLDLDIFLFLLGFGASSKAV